MKPAPAATRTLAVLNYMTAHPNMSFTLSELSRALEVSPASMSAILLAMTESGYVIRDRRHLTYSLGPAAVAAGHAASIRHPVIETARPELRRLATFGGECIGSSAVGDDILILAIEGRPTGQSREMWIGQRIPLIPPFGQIFLAWEDESVVTSWVSRLSPPAVEQHGRELVHALGSVRGRGVSVGLRNAKVEAVLALINESAHRGVTNDNLHAELERAIPEQVEDYTLSEIVATETYDVANLAAPVFGPDGRVVLAMTLYGIHGIGGTELLKLCEEMIESGRTVTRQIGGRWPLMNSTVANTL